MHASIMSQRHSLSCLVRQKLLLLDALPAWCLQLACSAGSVKILSIPLCDLALQPLTAPLIILFAMSFLPSDWVDMAAARAVLRTAAFL